MRNGGVTGVGIVVALLALAPARADEPPAMISINWRLLTAALQGGIDNGFVMTCKQAGLTSLTIAVKGSDGKPVTRSVSCPAADDNGMIDFPLHGKGPFTVSATAPGKRTLRSEQVRRVTAGDAVTLRIYVRGCDSICD
jgi:hypothetical protein